MSAERHRSSYSPSSAWDLLAGIFMANRRATYRVRDVWDAGKLRRFLDAWNDGIETACLEERFGLPAGKAANLASKLRLDGHRVLRQAERNLLNV